MVSNVKKSRKEKMKNKMLIIATIVFFLTVNTAYYWQGKNRNFSDPYIVDFNSCLSWTWSVAVNTNVYFN
jgi:hypothetical protein